jgi:hypothetical protein
LSIAFLILISNALAFAKAQGENLSTPSTGAVVADPLVLRPSGLAGKVLGTVAFLVSLPVTLSFHKTDQVERILVKEPFYYTFERPLGEM